VAAALAAPGLDACVQRVARLLLEHAGHSLGDDVLLVVAAPLAEPGSRPRAALRVVEAL
jgi:hypothetical protein